MTNEQKEQIKKLRDSGYGYATIAGANVKHFFTSLGKKFFTP